MSVNTSSDPNTETEYHDPVPSGLKDMQGLLRHLQMTHMDNTLSTHWNESMPEKDDVMENNVVLSRLTTAVVHSFSGSRILRSRMSQTGIEGNAATCTQSKIHYLTLEKIPYSFPIYNLD